MLHTLFKAESSSDSLVFSNSTYQRISAFFFPKAISTTELIWTRLVRHINNRGLSQTRNTALSLAETPYLFILDADNQIYSRAIAALRQAIENSGDAMAYSLLETFGDEGAIINNSLWAPDKFRYGNYIDAMTLIRTGVLRELGRYRRMMNNFGWEDYDLWCSFVDRGLKGCHVPQILCRYRVHKASMLRTVTNRFVSEDVRRVRDDFKAHHKMEFTF
jgi:glycosyltransferase involved in cell wall biosynthesis